MVQANLFENPQVGRARRRDPETSKQAAKTVHTAELEARVVDALKRCWMTTHQLSEHLDVPLVSISPRIAPLVRKGLVRDSGERRAGASGRKSIVWKAT